MTDNESTGPYKRDGETVYATETEQSTQDDGRDWPDHTDPEWLHHAYHLLGLSQYEMAELVDVNQTTICKRMQKHDVEARPRDEAVSRAQGGHEKLFDEEWIREKYEAGNSQKEIAEELGVSREAVKRSFQKHDIETRSLSESMKLRNEKEYGDEEYRRKEWLEHEYWVLMKGSGQIARENGWGKKTVLRWLHRHDIPVRSKKASQLLEYKREKCVPATNDDNRDVVTAGTGLDHKWRDLKDREQGCWVPYRDKSWLEARIAEGFNPREIAEICPSDATPNTIRGWIDRLGIENPGG